MKMHESVSPIIPAGYLHYTGVPNKADTLVSEGNVGYFHSASLADEDVP